MCAYALLTKLFMLSCLLRATEVQHGSFVRTRGILEFFSKERAAWINIGDTNGFRV